MRERNPFQRPSVPLGAGLGGDVQINDERCVSALIAALFGFFMLMYVNGLLSVSGLNVKVVKGSRLTTGVDKKLIHLRRSALAANLRRC